MEERSNDKLLPYMNEPILYCAPGGGLGHLTRACAMALRLERLGVAVRIVTHSPFADAMERLTGCAIDRIPRQRWRRDLMSYVRRRAARVVALDSFPRGLAGEWEEWRAPTETRILLVARRLDVEAYAGAAGPGWNVPLDGMSGVLAAEPLDDDEEKMLAGWDVEIERLPGRIRLPEDIETSPPPDALERLLDGGRLWLAVHAGPEHETRELIDRARAEGARELAVVSPWSFADMGCPTFDYFPAARLFARARRVVGGAGYNMMAECEALGERYAPVAFPRKFDDQNGRIEGPKAGAEDGGPRAAEWITKFL